MSPIRTAAVTLLLGALALPGALLFANHAHAAADGVNADLGKSAPDFTLTDVNGKSIRLSELKGKRVVLEWFNPDCPFVKYAHTKGPLKELGNKYEKQGVIWLAINSSAPGKQGNGQARNRAALSEYGIHYPVLLDESGQVGKRYGARSTPHLFIIDDKGTLVYRGGVDNAPLGDSNGAAKIDYVEDALGDLAAGRAVRVSDTKAYGCSVKYGG